MQDYHVCIQSSGRPLFFCRVGSTTDTPASTNSNSNSSNTIPVTVESTISTPATDPSVSSFKEIHNMTNTLNSLYRAAQSQAIPTLLPNLPPFGHASSVMGDDGEVISISSSSYGMKRSHDSDSMTTSTSTSIPQSLSSQPQAPSTSTALSSYPSIPGPLSPASPLKKCSKGKSKDVIAPPSRAQKEKITTAVAINGMQGTINHMTNMLANFLDPNELAKAPRLHLP